MKLVLVLSCIFVIIKAGNTYVSITVDDGWDYHLQFSEKLDSFGVKGTFYINSGRINLTDRLTLDELKTIGENGHDIAGHTLLHENLQSQTLQEQNNSICQDRAQLLNWGFNVTSFAFPYGADTPESFKFIMDCGFNAARDSGGIRTNTSCFNCPIAESIPPINPYQLRTISYRSSMGVEGLKWYVNQAINGEATSGTGDKWVIFIFHEYGYFPDKTAYILPAELDEFLSWLQNQNVIIETVNNIIGSVKQPIFTNVYNPNIQAKPNIVFTFDDGTIDHLNVSSKLEQYGFRGTFYVNSGTVGTQGFMKKSDLTKLQNQGHEIGGHSKTGAKLWLLTTEEATDEICGDKQKLTNWNLIVNSFAYPYGGNNNELETIASGCGYTTARDVGGIKTFSSCESCPKAIELPMGRPMVMRSFNVKSYHTLGDLIWQIRQAEEQADDYPRALIFIFEKICNECAVAPDLFDKLLMWLKSRNVIGTTVVPIRNLY